MTILTHTNDLVVPDDGAALEYLHQMLTEVVLLKASDLHLTAGVPPMVRVRGELDRLRECAPLTPDELAKIIRALVNDEQWERFLEERELDMAYSVRDVGRFRVNVYRQRGVFGVAFRVIPSEIPDLETLGLPPAVARFAELKRGLVLVTGPTGSGKSTTLASLLDVANRTRSGHILTIEDPIEYVHRHGRCIVNQREVGADTTDFSVALRHALRQDPDIILVGELRDLETIAVAVTAAETGHLVLATLHTRSASTAVDRLIDVFPAAQQQQIRAQLAGCLEGVVAQALAPTLQGSGRVAVCEVMVMTPAIRTLIREGKVHQINTAIQSAADIGMITFDNHLAQRVLEGQISAETAMDLAHQPDEFRRLARF